MSAEARPENTAGQVDISFVRLQQWCAAQNAQVICNPDGTVYVATGEALRAQLCEPGSLATAISHALSTVRR